MKVLMEQDDGGRRTDNIGLACGHESPGHTIEALGSGSFEEPMPRVAAETHLTEDSRLERKRCGHVPWAPERAVPDVGGVGWRTRAGHLLKNQSFYPQTSKQNLWDNPTFAGVNTWKEYHGPKMRADAEIMDRLDRFDQDQDEWEAKKAFVNTSRVETLDRFYNRKLNRTQLATSTSWAPHRKARREVHNYYNTFDSAMDEKPQKELKKVFTEKVLSSDRDAIRSIAKRIQNEDTWKHVFKQMEQERRQDFRADLQQRQAHTDRLMMLSGQPVKQHLPPGVAHRSLINSSVRTEELAVARPPPSVKDVCAGSDFRGLIHVDNPHALEALFPGSGHELSAEFRARATASTRPGFPPPQPAETPRGASKKESREARMRQTASVSKFSIPASSSVIEHVCARHDDESLKDHAMAQFLPTVAPPPPDQGKGFMNEDFSPTSTLHNPSKMPTKLSMFGPHSASPKEFVPPPTVPYAYAVLSPTSQDSRMHETNGLGSTMSLRSLRATASAPMLGATHGSQASGFELAGKRAGRSQQALTRSVCDELDAFEGRVSDSAMPPVSNFFGTPRGSRAQRNASKRYDAARRSAP